MTTTMGPPPANPPSAAADDSTTATADLSTSDSTKATPMSPPLTVNDNPSSPEREAESSGNHQQEAELNPQRNDTLGKLTEHSNSTDTSNDGTSSDVEMKQEQRNGNVAVPYKIPEWSGPPVHEFSLEVLKDGAIIDQFDVLVVLFRPQFVLTSIFHDLHFGLTHSSFEHASTNLTSAFFYFSCLLRR